jgi:hypothetical protein
VNEQKLSTERRIMTEKVIYANKRQRAKLAQRRSPALVRRLCAGRCHAEQVTLRAKE